MTFAGLKNQTDIANLIAYLKQFGPDGQPALTAGHGGLACYLHMSGSLDIWNQTGAILGFAALAQDTRLEVFRLLVSREPDGMAAGDIAR